MVRILIYIIPLVLCGVWYYRDGDVSNEFLAALIGLFWPITLPIKFIGWLIRKLRK